MDIHMRPHHLDMAVNSRGTSSYYYYVTTFLGRRGSQLGKQLTTTITSLSQTLSLFTMARLLQRGLSTSVRGWLIGELIHDGSVLSREPAGMLTDQAQVSLESGAGNTRSPRGKRAVEGLNLTGKDRCGRGNIF
eukprot:6175869-Pleurochrysis_carterae.AAC.12